MTSSAMSLIFRLLLILAVLLGLIYAPRLLRGEKLSKNLRIELIGISIVMIMLALILYATDNSIIGFP